MYMHVNVHQHVFICRCCDYNTSADQPQLLHMYQCAVDTLRILITTGSKVILELLLSMDTITQLCQLLPLGNIGTSTPPPSTLFLLCVLLS